MSINIGNNNKIKRSTIIDSSNLKLQDKAKESFVNRHPVLIGIVCSIIASIIMMFSFWEKIAAVIKNLF